MDIKNKYAAFSAGLLFTQTLKPVTFPGLIPQSGGGIREDPFCPGRIAQGIHVLRVAGLIRRVDRRDIFHGRAAVAADHRSLQKTFAPDIQQRDRIRDLMVKIGQGFPQPGFACQRDESPFAFRMRGILSL